MKRFISRQFIGVLALLGSSAGMAATVTITPSTLAPNVGDNFTLTITSDVANSYAATLALAFDATKVVYVSGTFLAPFNFYSKVSVPTLTPTDFYIEAPTAQVGTYDVAVLTFKALASGAAGVVINDDNCATGSSGWADDVGGCIAGITYNQANVTVAGGAPPVPVIAVTTANPLAFGNVTVAATANQALTVKNNGLADLVIPVNGVTPPAGTEFSITDIGNCDGKTLAPTVSCTMNVQFIPGAVQAYTDSVVIASNDLATPTVTVNLTGSGTAAVPTAGVTDTVAPINDLLIPFGNVTVAGTSPLQTVTVTNTGTVGLDIGQIAAPAPGGNPLAAPFFISSDNCSNTTVLPAGTCTLKVQFDPTAAVSSSDTFSIPSNTASSPITFSVTGIGVAPLTPDITVTDASGSATDLAVTFGTVAVGSTASQTVTVKNDGGAPLSVTSATVAGATYSVGNNGCTAPLAPAASCTIRVDFTPALAQAYPGSLSIASNDPDEPTVLLALSGTGVDNVLVIDGGSSALDPWSLLLLAGLPLVRRRRPGSKQG